MTEYKLLTYDNAGHPAAGIFTQGRVHDAAALLGLAAPIGIIDIISDWPRWGEAICAAIEETHEDGTPLEETRLMTPIPEPRALFCAGANYADHIAEMSSASNTTGSVVAPEGKPWHFLKHTGSVVGPDAVVTLPAGSQSVDWEAELAVVIGTTARNISVENALDHICGYTIANDLSARDLSRWPEAASDSPFRYDWLAHKSFDGACPMGPWITPVEQIPDPQTLAIQLEIDGETMQNSNTELMIFSVAEQISHLSSVLTLQPGDVILTGTPSGVGMGRGRFLKSGETVRIVVEGIGELVHKVV